MDLWSLMNQAQAPKFPSNRYSQYIPSKTNIGYGSQSFEASLYIGQPGVLAPNRFPMSAVTQAAAILPKQSTPTSLSLMNLVLENNLLRSQLQLLAPQNQEIVKREAEPIQSANSTTFETIKRVESLTSQEKKQPDSQLKKRRYRRLAKQIERVNCCPVQSCSKSYGSEGSLHQHIRLKHEDFDIFTWIRDKIKNGGAVQMSGKDSIEASKADQSPSFKNEL